MNNNCISIDDLMKGKATVIKNNNYFSTKDYVAPFIDKMSKFTDDFIIQVKLPTQYTRTEENDINYDDITYNRVYVQAVMPQKYQIDNHSEVVGMVYGLDCKQPIVKLFRGGLNHACTNLCTFDSTLLNIQELAPETAIDYTKLNDLMDKSFGLENWLKKLHEKSVKKTDININELLGSWIRKSLNVYYNNNYGKVKFASKDVLSAYKMLFEETDSPYYCNTDSIDMFNVYNAFTQTITNDSRDIMNKYEKCLLLSRILGINDIF